MKRYNGDQIPIIIGKPRKGIYIYSSENGNGSKKIKIYIFNDTDAVPLTEDLTLSEANTLGKALLKITTNYKKGIYEENNNKETTQSIKIEDGKEKNNLKRN